MKKRYAKIAQAELNIFLMFCLGKCLTQCLSETKCKSFQGAAISGYKKIRTSLVLNVTLRQLEKRMANEKDVPD